MLTTTNAESLTTAIADTFGMKLESFDIPDAEIRNTVPASFYAHSLRMLAACMRVSQQNGKDVNLAEPFQAEFSGYELEVSVIPHNGWYRGRIRRGDSWDEIEGETLLATLEQLANGIDRIEAKNTHMVSSPPPPQNDRITAEVTQQVLAQLGIFQEGVGG